MAKQSNKKWHLGQKVDALKTVEYLEDLEKKGFTIFQLVHTNEFIQQDKKILNLKQDAAPAMILAVQAVCYKEVLE